MRRARRKLVVIAAVIVVAAAAWTMRSVGRGPAPAMQARLESAVASGATSFDFAAADPDFAWDRMYVFHPYSTRAMVERALDFRWPDFARTNIESSDSVVLVVFVRGSEVVGWYEQPRTIDLNPARSEVGCPRSAARFNVARTDDGRFELHLTTTTTNTTAPATLPGT